MNNKALSIIILTLIVPYILFANSRHSVNTYTQGADKPALQESRTIELTNVVYSDKGDFILPEKPIQLRSNKDTRGKGFLHEEDGHLYLYLLYADNSIAAKPEFISTVINEKNDFVITSELTYDDPKKKQLK